MCGVTVALWFTWSIPDYWVWDRATNSMTTEVQTTEIARETGQIYSWPHLASVLHMNAIHVIQTEKCNEDYTKILTTDGAKQAAIYDPWIAPYKVNMSVFKYPDYRNYSTVNDWFKRELSPDPYYSQRPIAQYLNQSIIVSPCDARVMVFPNVTSNMSLWIKGDKFSVTDLLGGYTDRSKNFINGALVILRLARQDYHRFHLPVTAYINETFFLGGTLYSVGFDAIRSNNEVLYNQRVVTYLDTKSYANIGTVAYVAVGAACVGSVFMEHSTNTFVLKGDQLGYFQFGGSTIVLIFQPNTIQFSSDLIFQSSRQVESLVRVGQEIGTVI